MQKNKHADASDALLWLRGKNYDPTIELTEMHLAMEQQKEGSESIVSAMMRRTSVKALSISFGLFICQQMCGINVVIFYTTKIFEVGQVMKYGHRHIEHLTLYLTSGCQNPNRSRLFNSLGRNCSGLCYFSVVDNC